MKHFYALWYRLDKRNRYLLWHSEGDAPDGVFLGRDGNIPVFQARDELQIYAERNGFSLADEAPILHDFDGVMRRLKKRAKTSGSTPAQCNGLLDAWNLFDDIAHSLGQS